MTTDLHLSAFERCLLQGDIDFISMLLSYWPVVSIMRLKSVNFLLKCLVDEHCRCEWDIDSFLLNWFRHPMDFRGKLGQCDGIVSGSQVLQFFDRTCYSDSDFDIFLRPEGALEMGRWLQANDYVYSPSSAAVPTFEYAFHLATRRLLCQGGDRHSYINNNSIIQIFNFVRPGWVEGSNNNNGQIQVIVVRHHPIKHVLNFHSS